MLMSKKFPNECTKRTLLLFKHKPQLLTHRVFHSAETYVTVKQTKINSSSEHKNTGLEAAFLFSQQKKKKKREITNS